MGAVVAVPANELELAAGTIAQQPLPVMLDLVQPALAIRRLGDTTGSAPVRPCGGYLGVGMLVPLPRRAGACRPRELAVIGYRKRNPGTKAPGSKFRATDEEASATLALTIAVRIGFAWARENNLTTRRRAHAGHMAADNTPHVDPPRETRSARSARPPGKYGWGHGWGHSTRRGRPYCADLVGAGSLPR